MKQNLFFVMVALGSMFSFAASAEDNLKSVYDISLVASKTVLMHDECVRQGFIRDEAANAEERFRASIEKTSGLSAADLGSEISGAQIADAEAQALAAAKSGAAPVADSTKCEEAQRGMAQVTYAYGLE